MLDVLEKWVVYANQRAKESGALASIHMGALGFELKGVYAPKGFSHTRYISFLEMGAYQAPLEQLKSITDKLFRDLALIYVQHLNKEKEKEADHRGYPFDN